MTESEILMDINIAIFEAKKLRYALGSDFVESFIINAVLMKSEVHEVVKRVSLMTEEEIANRITELRDLRDKLMDDNVSKMFNKNYKPEEPISDLDINEIHRECAILMYYLYGSQRGIFDI